MVIDVSYGHLGTLEWFGIWSLNYECVTAFDLSFIDCPLAILYKMVVEVSYGHLGIFVNDLRLWLWHSFVLAIDLMDATLFIYKCYGYHVV